MKIRATGLPRRDGPLAAHSADERPPSVGTWAGKKCAHMGQRANGIPRYNMLV